jgi:predicted house-cleaning noncanonical NTP pyrophosphatase (MazG superfamily)
VKEREYVAVKNKQLKEALVKLVQECENLASHNEQLKESVCEFIQDKKELHDFLIKTVHERDESVAYRKTRRSIDKIGSKVRKFG